MATKPAQICQLQKGKLIDGQKGFVDTFNWAVQAIANLKGGENCEVTWPTDDTPTIDCTANDDEGSGGGGEYGVAAVYDVQETTHDDARALEITYTDDRQTTYIRLGGGSLSSEAVTSIAAGSNNVSAQFDSTNQDYLTYQTNEGNEVTVALPYVNAVADLSCLSVNLSGDRKLTWNYTRSDLSVEPIDLGVEFVDETETSSTGIHTKYKLKSADDSNVEFTFDNGEITVGVYYI